MNGFDGVAHEAADQSVRIVVAYPAGGVSDVVARALADKLAAAGWRDVSWKNLTGGIVALHRATKS